MPGEADDYLYAAINQTQFVFAKVMKGVSPYDAANFLEDLRKNAPTGISSVITSDHEAFGRAQARSDRDVREDGDFRAARSISWSGKRNFVGRDLAGDFSRRMRENGRNSVRRPRHASLADRNCEGFCRPAETASVCRDWMVGRFALPHAAFALRLRTWPSGLRTFEATFAFTVVTAR